MHLPFSLPRRRTVRIGLLSVILLLPASAVFADPSFPSLFGLETSDTDTVVVEVLPEPRFVAVVPRDDSDERVEPSFGELLAGFPLSGPDLEPQEGNALAYNNPERFDPARITAQVTDIQDGDGSLVDELIDLVGINLVVVADVLPFAAGQDQAGEAPGAALLLRDPDEDQGVVIDAIDSDSVGEANLTYRFPEPGSDSPGFASAGQPSLAKAPEVRDWDDGAS